MIIQCDQCEKKYKIDPSKLKQETASLKCRQCGNIIQVSKDTQEPVAETEDATTIMPDMTPDPAGVSSAPAATAAAPPQPSSSSRKGLRLSAKMLLLFFAVPVALVVIASGLYWWQLSQLTNRISSDSYTIVEKLSQELVNDTARMVANQCKLYLDNNPGLGPDEFNLDVEFRALALQTVGETGYTCIYNKPDIKGLSAVWVHPNEKIIGVNLPPAMQKAMGPLYLAWWDIYKGAYDGKASSGYYKWKEKDGSLRDKYMTCVPLKGTPYIVAATTYVDEINREVQSLRGTAVSMTTKTRNIILIVFAATIVLLGSTVLFYSRRLRNNLTILTDAAEKISIGELNTQIKVKSKDEIMDLAEAISRMQESIRLSMDRLRSRR